MSQLLDTLCGAERLAACRRNARTPEQMHRERARFLRQRALEFKAEGSDEAASYAADLECEADELDAACNHGPLDGERE